tara:strand:+ start:457 stop:1140 length:684 start_codon:yes stop_codon:yes gene_type:complete
MEFNLEEHGFIIIKNFFSEEELNSIEYLDKYFEYPYTPLAPTKFSNVMIDTKKVLLKATALTGKKYKPFMGKFYHKSAFEGSHEIYHQDYYYRQALNIPNSEYLQTFFAMHDHDYAPLNVFIGSHKKGLQPHRLVMERDGNAKFAISKDILKHFKNDFYPVKLKKGDGIFFDYSLIHGSGSNGSPFDQSRLIIQMCTQKLPKIEHGSDRRLYEIDTLQKMIDAKQPK